MEKKKFIIDEKMITEATDYIPFTNKMEIVNELAESCIEAVDKRLDDIATETQLPIPQLYKERCGAKQYFIMYYFLTKYLHIEIKADDWNDEQFDYYASSHIFNQLERFKGWSINRDCLKNIPIESPNYALKAKQLRNKETEIKNKVFDILYDFKELKKMLDTEIFNLKESKNNSLDRIQNYIDLFADPQTIQKLSAELQKTISEVENTQKKLNDKRATAKKTETAEKK